MVTKITKRAIALMMECIFAETEEDTEMRSSEREEEFVQVMRVYLTMKQLWYKLKLDKKDEEPDEDSFINADYSLIKECWNWDEMKKILGYAFYNQYDRDDLEKEILTIFQLIYGTAEDVPFFDVCSKMTYGHWFTTRDFGADENYAGCLKMDEDDFALYKTLSPSDKIEYCSTLNFVLDEKNLKLRSKNEGLQDRVSFTTLLENSNGDPERINLEDIIDEDGNVYVGLYDFWQ